MIEKLKQLLEAAGKVPVVCGPTPGFIVPRLQALVMNEAARMVEEGAASAEDIDKATRYGLGLRFSAIGVVEFIDYGGNDILYYASRYLAKGQRRAVRDAPNRAKIDAGRALGPEDRPGLLRLPRPRRPAYRKDVLARTLAALDILKRRREA